MKFLKIKNSFFSVMGVLLMLIAFLIFPDSAPWYYEMIVYNIGLLLIIIPKYPKIKHELKLMKNRSIGILLFLTTFCATGQDYSKQIDAFAKSFAEKNTTAISAFMSSELKFVDIPTTNTPAIMKNIVSNLPKLKSMTLIESKQGSAKVKYDFEVLGVRESIIFFDSSGKIIKIELVDNLIKQEAEARRQQQESVQSPQIGEFEKKHVTKTVEFVASDGLIINGNLYEVDKQKPIVLLCHQAGYNRIEYADIAPRLNALGYNCLAIDLRSGGTFAGEPNTTNQRAIEQGLNSEMIDAQQDVTAAVAFLNQLYKQKVIVWGSSFSSSLALLESRNNPKIKAIIGFSPGDYFGDKAPSLATVFSKIDIPFWVSSSKQEAEVLKTLIGDLKLKKKQQQFIPESNGFHGSRALWTGQKGAEDYWASVIEFLRELD
ncbi:lysophospholipase [Psychroserpens sp. SPM9]|uniref:lysophospholipase n=1 Tax=Psychroserpens sp. SPM9 TaxID=2975598 RepID=UPI0021A82044|nr:lysophospholipase [Psychroserpens sp. SPM9]MDG5491988.1 lysophospholipase [Psychroserpens sp. SPM9]